jgi:hypothetical protein
VSYAKLAEDEKLGGVDRFVDLEPAVRLAKSQDRDHGADRNGDQHHADDSSDEPSAN